MGSTEKMKNLECSDNGTANATYLNPLYIHTVIIIHDCTYKQVWGDVQY